MGNDGWTRLRDVVERAMELAGAEREAFLAEACGGDAGLVEEARSLLSEDRDDGWLEVQVVARLDEDVAGRRVGPYELSRQIGAGGMGAVFLGRRVDGEFDQRVAVKLLKRGMDTDDLLARFRGERQVLARLEHPGIARLIDGGATEDGLPYLVMEYVEGAPIDRWCDDRKLSVRERLELFLRVCEALRYAHRNLVVHRDLKPSNVLVTDEGRPVLLDFGLAKVLDPDLGPLEATRPTQRFLTPEYASPEQVRGLPVTTATDVYSAGALLYRLLTGRLLHRFTSRSPLEIDRVVCEEEPTRPSAAAAPDEVAAQRGTTPRALERALAGDLDTIVLMALRKEPERRYSSVEQLAEDVHRHLENMPVLARGEGALYRAAKFARRNKLALAAGSAVVLALALGLATSLSFWREEQRQRAVSERRFDDVRDLATSFLFDVHDELRHLPGTIPLRERVVRTAKEHLEALALEESGEPELMLELARAYVRLGEAEGSPFQASLGRTSDAVLSFARAREIADELEARGFEHPLLATVRAGARRSESEARAQLGERETALETARDAVSIADGAATARERTLSRVWLASCLASVGLHEEAILRLEEACELAEGGLERHAGDPGAALLAADVFVILSARLVDLGEIAAAEVRARRALEMLEPAIAASPDDLALERSVAEAELQLATVLTDAQAEVAARDTDEEAQERLGRALELFAEQVDLDPRNLATRRSLAKASHRFGEQLSFEERFEEALPWFLRAEEERLRILAVDPEHADDRRELAVTRDRIGYAYNRLRRNRESIHWLRLAREFWEEELASDPSNALARRDLSVNTYRLAFSVGDLPDGDAPASERAAALREALDLFEECERLLAGLDQEGLLAPSDLAELRHVRAMLEVVNRKLAELETGPP